MNKTKFEEIKKKALDDHIPIIMDDTLEYLDNILLNTNKERILEIGTAVGYSSICFSRYLSNTGKIDTIERDEERAKEAVENIKSMELEDKINVLVGDAVEILPTLDNKYDVIFIDAAKRKISIFLKWSLKNIKTWYFNNCR